MSNKQNQVITKTAYTKPALIAYGSLIERTKMFGAAAPDRLMPQASCPAITILGPSLCILGL